MDQFIEYSRRRLQAGPCEAFDSDLYAAALLAFLPVWIASQPPDPTDERAFIAAHRRQAADDPNTQPLAPHDFGRITQAHDGLFASWDIERSTHAETLAAEAAAARALMLAEATDERVHPTMPTPAPETPNA